MAKIPAVRSSPELRCLVCARPMAYRGNGRRREYCSRACRELAQFARLYRERRDSLHKTGPAEAHPGTPTVDPLVANT